MSNNESKHPRNYFRLEYPAEVRPKILIDQTSYPIINLSEGGVKLRVPRQEGFSPTDQLNGVIIFHNSDQTEVIGKVIRQEKDAIVLQLSEGVPLQQIMVEQRFLLNKYGTLRRPKNE